MRSTRWMVVSAGVLLSLSAYAAETLTVIEHPDHESTLQRQPGTDSLGDLIVFHNSVFGADDAKQIGSDQGYCVRVAVGESYECTWTLAIAGGQIVVSGPYHDKGDSVLAITGGTGKYAGARGVMYLHPQDEKNSAYRFRYALL